MRFATKVIHAGQAPDATTGAVMPPVSLASTYAQSSPGEHKGFEYSRTHNPTRFALERMLAHLEGTGLTEAQDRTLGGFAFVSGMAAIGMLLDLIPAGGRVIAMDDVYGGTNRLLSRVRTPSQGIDVERADLSNPANLERAIRPDTQLVWVETPTNPMLKVADLQALREIARAKAPGAILGCDNTFASPFNQRPLSFGFDVVMHSTTKYINGHSDCVGGALITNSADLAEKIRFVQNSLGSSMSPFDAYLTLRGIKTLDVRMRQHNDNALRVAQFLEGHTAIERVIYPGLPSHPQHEVATRQMSPGFSGMVSAHLSGGLTESRRFLERLRIFALAESLGGVESLVEHPAIMTHASVPAEQRQALGISDNFVRFSVGIEDADDLIADIEQALA